MVLFCNLRHLEDKYCSKYLARIWLEIFGQLELEIVGQMWLEIFQKSFDIGRLRIPDYQGRWTSPVFWHLSKIYRATDKNLRMWVLGLWACQGFSGSIHQPLGIGLFQRSQEMSTVDLHRPHLRSRFFYWLQDVWTNRGFRTPGLSDLLIREPNTKGKIWLRISLSFKAYFQSWQICDPTMFGGFSRTSLPDKWDEG